MGKSQTGIPKGIKATAFNGESNHEPLGEPHRGISLQGPRAPSVPRVLDPHLPPLSRGPLWDPAPEAPTGTYRQDAGSAYRSPTLGEGAADWSSRATFWESRDSFPRGSLVDCRSRETEKLKNFPTRGSRKSRADVGRERESPR